VGVETKLCGRCHDEKPLDEFRWLKGTGRADRRDSYCRDCRNAHQRESYRRHAEKRKASNRARYLQNRDRYLESNRRWQAANAERIAEKQYGWKASLRKHGWTPDDYERVLAEQGGVCACCGSASPGKRLRKFCVDHDHATGTVRGLLCTSCNQGIGQLGDTLEGVEAAARYLRLTTGC
jgi:hypothetical protein